MHSPQIQILIIEDNDAHAQFLTRLLLTDDVVCFKLATASKLAPGLQLLQEGRYDLILLDLTLPDSDGVETFIRVFECAPEIPIVVLSGIDDVALAIETVQLGAQDYLVKGHVDNHLLVRSLQYAMERKRVQLQLEKANEELEQRVLARTEELQKEIAERRRAEEATLESNRQLAEALQQLRAAQQEIIQRERMLALGRMANGIAHDFNNALAPILGFSELLLLKPQVLSDDAKARSYLEMIQSAAKSSAKVVSRLREFYRHRDSPEVFSPIILNDLIAHVIAITQPRWKDEALAAGVQIEIRTELGTVPTVLAHEAELKEALANLLFNAADAIAGQGCITIRSEVQGNWAVVTVADNGVGMSEDVRARCLEPFFTTKSDQGTGLGLGSVYGIVRRHDGSLDIQSELGRGTSVAICLPMERNPRMPEAALPLPSVGAPIRVLVVEDEPLVREVLTVYLSEDEHTIVVAENGREGLEKFQTGEFDVVLTDRAMPGMNGDALAVEIKKLKPNQKVILLTGFGDLMTGAGEQPTGVDLVVAKPFTLSTLRNAITKVLGR